MMDWIRYRFYTKAVDDYRPLIFNPSFPWWCSGYSDNAVIIIAYLPKGEDLTKYWEDAYSVESTKTKKMKKKMMNEVIKLENDLFVFVGDGFEVPLKTEVGEYIQALQTELEEVKQENQQLKEWKSKVL